MPKNAITVDEWISQVIPADQLDAKTKEAVLGVIKDPKVWDKINAGYMRQEEFSKRMNDWQTEKAAEEERLALATKQYQDKFAELSEWEQKGEAAIAEFKTAAQQAEERRAKAEAALRKLKTEYELSDDDLGVKLENDPVPTHQPAFDPSKFMTVEQARDLLARNNKEVAGVMTRFPVQLAGLLRRHQQVFGAGELPDVEGLYEKFQKTGKPLDKLWEETYKVPETLAEQADAQLKQQLAEAEARGEKRAIERLNTPLTSFDPTGAKSPALRAHGAEGLGLKPQDKKSGIQKAVERWEQNRMAEAKAARDRAGAAA